MHAVDPAHVLVVVHGTAATRALGEAVRARAARGPCWFGVVVPTPPGRDGADRASKLLDGAVPLLEEAAHRPVEGSVSSRHDPMDAIEEALLGDEFDEIILATTQHALSRLLHVDLPRRVAHLGLPLTTIFTETGDA